jgi:hypothetical protein
MRVARRDERGVTIVLFALLLVTFTVFVAFAVDLGGAFNQRRQTQSGADFASLGAAQDLPDTSVDIVNRVKDLVNDTLGTTFTLVDWQTANCTDADSLPLKPVGYECISFDTSFSRIRVKVPMQAPYKTNFAQVIGINQINITAVAEARRRTPGFGGVLPFALPVTAATSGQACLKTGPGGHVDAIPPCNGPDSGNFGVIDIRLYGNSALGTSPSCTSGGDNERLINNAAVGADHELVPYAGVIVLDDCVQSKPNTIDVTTGDKSSAFDTGMLSGGPTDFSDGKPARLRRVGDSSGDYYDRTTSINGPNVNDAGLWEFIPSGLIFDVPPSCRRSVFDAALTDGNLDNKNQLRGLLDTCFADYQAGAGCFNNPCQGDLFTMNSRTEAGIDLYDIQLSPRFGYVPRLTGSFPSGTSGTVQIAGFNPVYLQRLFVKCNATSCAIDFDPGVGDGPQNQSGKAEAITAFVISPQMLPGSLGTNPYQLGQNQFIELVR